MSFGFHGVCFMFACCLIQQREANFCFELGLFTMRGRRHGESLFFHWGIVPGLWFRQVTHDVKLANSQNLPPRLEDCFKVQTRRLSS
jgi:hypothetical protein